MRGVAEHLQKLHQWGPLDLAKRVKLARSAAVATNQQPKRMPQLVPEFEKVQQALHVPKDVAISLDSKRNTMQCKVFQCNDAEIFIPCKTRMLRRTPQRGCSSCGGGDQVSNTVSMEHKALRLVKMRWQSKMSKTVTTVQALCVWNATKMSKETKLFLGCTGHLNNF